MSVNAVSGTSLRQDLVSALRQARGASAQPIDPSAFSTASQDAGATQGTSSSSQTTGAATTPAMSSDMLASLLQLQSDFSQMGLQAGVTSGADPDDTSNGTAASGTADASQAASGAAPVHHHHHGHHARSPESDATTDAQAAQSTTATDTTSASGATTAGSASGTDLGDGLQSLFQQITKAVAAYVTGGPVGVAAAALTTSTKA